MAGRAWGLPPSEIWGMTLAEFAVELQAKGSGPRYAGGMTEGDIDEIRAQATALREKRAKARVTSPA